MSKNKNKESKEIYDDQGNNPWPECTDPEFGSNCPVKVRQ